MASTRDEFPKAVVRTLGTRAAYICSNPNCRKLTAGPHSDPAKHVITGEAAHICAAAPGGPRYDSQQTPEERKSASNGIWLCAVCSKKVDTDWAAWPASELLKMKAEHERWVDGQEMIPRLPEITVKTLRGLRLHNNLKTIAQQDVERLREQQLLIRNPNRVPLHNLKLAMFLPEEVRSAGHCSWNPAIQLDFRPAHTGWTVESAEGVNRVSAGQEMPTTNHILTLSHIPPGDQVELSLYTGNPVEVMICDESGGPLRPAPDPDNVFPPHHLLFFLKGTYQFILRGEYVTVEILVPLQYIFKDRLLTSLPVQDSVEPWDLSPMTRFPGLEFHG